MWDKFYKVCLVTQKVVLNSKLKILPETIPEVWQSYSLRSI